MMKEIIKDAEQRLNDKIPALKYIAQDWGQLSLYDKERPPVKFPCALVDLVSGQFTNDGALLQEGMITLVVSIADVSQNVSHRAPAALADMEMRIYDIMQDVYVALQGWSGGVDYSGWVRTGFSRSLRQDGIRMRNMTFTSNWRDTAAERPLIKKPVTSVKISAVRL